jgi:hypothetical protein
MPLEVQCSGPWLQVCNATQTGFQNSVRCDSAALCDDVAGQCREPMCVAGDYLCVGAQLQVCAADGSGYENASLCMSADQCDARAGMCVTGACTRGDYRCDGAWLQTCSNNGKQYENVVQCESEALCDATGEECDECVPPASGCATATQSRTCNAAGHWVLTDCLIGEICEAGACVAAP